MLTKQSFITKQISNDKKKRFMQSHHRQIFKEIRATMSKQKENAESFKGKYKSKQNERPKTAVLGSSIQSPNKRKLRRSNSFVRNFSYQINEIVKISSMFQKACEFKNSPMIKPEKMGFPKRVIEIRNKVRKQENESIKQCQKLRRKYCKNRDQLTNNYVGINKQSLKKVIPISEFTNQDIKMLIRCIEGGYIGTNDQYSSPFNKDQFLNSKKKFLTLDTLYQGVAGSKNKGIKGLNPSKIKGLSFQNMVYFIENQNKIKKSDAAALRLKMDLID